jgi:hypothetical protein
VEQRKKEKASESSRVKGSEVKSEEKERSAARVSCARRSTHSVSPATGPDRLCFDRFVYILSDEENKLSVSSAPSFLWIFGLGWYHLTSDCDIEALSLDSRIRPLAFGPGPHVMTIDDDNGERRAGSTYSPSKLVKSGKKELVIIAV